MSLNKAFILGNVGSDPEIKRGQVNVASLRVATTEKWVDKSGNKQEKTEWHTVVVFGKAVDFVEKYITKGTQVMVEGKIRYESYEKDGEKKFVTRIYADSIQSVGAGKKDGEGPTAPRQSAKTPAPQEAPQEVTGGQGEDDLPF